MKITAKCFILTMPLMTWLQTPFKNRITLSKHTISPISFKPATRHQQKIATKTQRIILTLPSSFGTGPGHKQLNMARSRCRITGKRLSLNMQGLHGHGITSNAPKMEALQTLAQEVTLGKATSPAIPGLEAEVLEP